MTKQFVVKINKMVTELEALADRMNTVDLLADQGDFNVFDNSIEEMSKPLPPEGISASSPKWQEFISAKNMFLEYCLKVAKEEPDCPDVLKKYVQILSTICVAEPSYYGPWIPLKTINRINIELRNLKRELVYIDDIEDQADKKTNSEGPSINIGNNNTIKDVIINQNSSGNTTVAPEDDEIKKTFVHQHPFITGIGASIIAAIIWAFFNGDKIIALLQGLIKG